MSSAAAVRARRPPKAAVDPQRPVGWVVESERLAEGTGTAPALTVFLAGAECPFTCVFCDLWRHTLDEPTPPGSLPAQLEVALAESGYEAAGGRVKLYNASNFFDPRAVPDADAARLAERLHPAARVVVESHPRLVGERAVAFDRRLGPRSPGSARLEVAMGLETVHPRALPLLGKSMTLADFDRAADRLAAAGIALRVFVLVGAPFVPAAESVEWAVASAAHAFARGAETVALIPVRGGNGELERLAADGAFTPPTLGDLEAALDGCLAEAPAGAAVTADLWDLERFARCPACAGARRRRLERINASGRGEPRVACECCADAGRQTAAG